MSGSCQGNISKFFFFFLIFTFYLISAWYYIIILVYIKNVGKMYKLNAL